MKKISYFLASIFIFSATHLFAQQSYEKADSLFYSGDYQSSEQAFNKVIKTTRDQKQFDNAIQKRAECLIRLGRIGEASNLADTLVNYAVQQKNIDGKIRGQALQGYILMNKGLADDAELKLQEAENALNSNNNELRAEVYNYLGLLYWSTGNNEKATDYLTTANNLFAKYGNKNQQAGVYNNLGLVYGETAPVKALEYYQLSEKLYISNYSEKHPSVALSCNNIGFAYLKQQNFTEAEKYFERSQHILLNVYGEKHPNFAFVTSALGQTYAAQGKTSRAIKNFEKAILIYQQVYGGKHPEIAATQNLLAEQYLKTNEFDLALATLQASLLSNSIGFDSKNIVENPRLSEAINPSIQLYSLSVKAQAFEKRHHEKTLKVDDLRQALKCLNACDSLLTTMRQTRTNKKDKIELGKIASEVYEAAVAVTLELNRITLNKSYYRERAFYYTEKNKAAALNDAIADARAKQFSGLPDSLLVKENELKANITVLEQQLAKSENMNAGVRKELLAANSTYEQFIDRLENQFPAYYNLKYNQSIANVKAVQASLPDNTTLVTYFLSESRKTITVFYISKKHFRFKSLELPSDLNRSLTGMRNSLLFRLDTELKRIAFDLYKKLDPLGGVNQSKHLVIIPDGPLSSLPFETLLDKKPKEETDWSAFPFLIKKYAISYHFSANLYVQGKNTGKNKADEKSLLAIAPVNFAEQQLSTLEGSSTEVDSLTQLIKTNGGKITCLKYSDASEASLKKEIGQNYTYLHLATHGLVNQNNPDLSCIYLFNNESNKNEDGILYAGEIYNLKLNSKLVTLSACQTGLGKVSKGEGLIGLSRAFLYAGANNLIVSLWSVSDASTALLMEQTYKNIFAGNSIAQALQQAKIKLLLSPDFKQPYYWAPFILIGQ